MAEVVKRTLVSWMNPQNRWILRVSRVVSYIPTSVLAKNGRKNAGAGCDHQGLATYGKPMGFLLELTGQKDLKNGNRSR